ncbi:MAG: LanC-like protein [Pseudomonadota bacterium]
MVMNLYIARRHEKLNEIPWSVEKANKVIDEIVRSALETFQGHQLWPVHPDKKETYQVSNPIAGLWTGAAGTIWAILRLQKLNSTLPKYDFVPYLDTLIEKQPISLAEFHPKLNIPLNAPGYLSGSSGIYLLNWKLTKRQHVLDLLENNIRQNITNPINELTWAAPGTMLCAWFLYQETQEEKWRDLFQQSAAYLFSTWQLDEKFQCYVWIQAMRGVQAIHLGAIHGFAGNILPLLKGIKLLSENQSRQLIERAENTLMVTAESYKNLANWLPCLGKPRPGRDQPMVQLCHGAPGIIIATGDLWSLSGEGFKNLLCQAGNLIWQAGPLKKPWGLCHGTAGNGYAFLKLFELTGDEVWLSRAKQFAMHAIYQYENMRNHYGCIRTEVGGGDLGLALYLQDCIARQTRFPMLDYF